MGWSSRMFWAAGGVMMLAAVALIAAAAVATSDGTTVESRLTFLTAVVMASAVLVTGGLFHVAGAVLRAAERESEDKAG